MYQRRYNDYHAKQIDSHCFIANKESAILAHPQRLHFAETYEDMSYFFVGKVI